ncbi:MAG: two-component system chemotaxis response regulator CheY [Pseudoalteromonas rhizosphaerae]|jgi:two-component system chemotaxis response regulator CheY|uniref:Response regulator n=1 Tax=Pseudoalteromonas neustonica TaxID=1840331 RepID=A0ABY3F8A8_9GAMM|nr:MULTISPECIES: response regulator [Pseudoalteromonas]MBB1291545.1 response regulator [Pseudoalteromonas sp. SR41-4]MBB1302732.1 response regulator [Pseudoalteromonas sp. SR44-8]MBB1307972.1 response regulator [Pseudoalteromonas sp. SR41-8]MBB1396043.1 response regulator [Pseudoalteromonas sp. SG44-8]MBB1410821.1 response regulator [Pseudoalteromonas sp. SG44-17]|tara:strand:- start:176 stop:973 length:798 start_codon:yes stop_codon:yes gene_type:complete
MKDLTAIANLSILLVEPSDVQQKLIIKSLTQCGVTQIETATSQAQTLTMLENYQPDLVISSMYFSDGSADSLLQKIRVTPGIEHQAFMLVSTERNKTYLEQLRQSGVLAILPKPFSAEAITRALKATLDIITEEEVELEHFDVTLLRVLVVDDSRFARKHIIRVLAGMGIPAPVEAENGKQAIDHLNSQSFDLIVTDYNMPEMDGKELTETVRSSNAYSHIPILMVSSEANDTHLANIAQAGVDAICDKPFEPATVRELLFKIMS